MPERWEQHPQQNLAETSQEMRRVLTPEQAFMTGALKGCTMRPDFPLKIQDITHDQTNEGDYLNRFTVTLFSGKKLRVTVEVEE